MILLRRIRQRLGSDLAIDLGTANTLVYAPGQGIVLDEPSMVAVRQDPASGTTEVIAVGEGTKKMLGRTPRHISAIRPLREGVIANFTIATRMLQHFIQKAQQGRLGWARPQVLICVSCAATQVERRAIKAAAIAAGARDALLMDEPLAAALGAGLPVHEARGSMVVDMGGGTTQAAVTSLDGIVRSQSARVGGSRLDEAIISFVRDRYGAVIGEETAERIKRRIGCAYPSADQQEITINALDRAQGTPRLLTLTSNDVFKALQEPLASITALVKTVLEEIPPDLGADVAERGIGLTGGGALLHDFDRLLREETGLPVWVAEEPLTCVVRGSGKALETATATLAQPISALAE